MLRAQASAVEGTRFNTDQVEALLNTLANRLDKQGIAATMIVVGGAAVALDVNPDREATIDIDVFAKLTEQIERVISEIAVEKSLPPGWINANAQQFMSPVASHSDLPIQTQVGDVTIYRIDNQSLLAMKLRAGRIGKDFSDIKALVESLGVRSVAEAQSILDNYYGSEEQMKTASAQLLEDLFSDDKSSPG